MDLHCCSVNISFVMKEDFFFHARWFDWLIRERFFASCHAYGVRRGLLRLALPMSVGRFQCPQWQVVGRNNLPKFLCIANRLIYVATP